MSVPASTPLPSNACSICHQPARPPEHLIRLAHKVPNPTCQGRPQFHEGCIAGLLRLRKVCPYCDPSFAVVEDLAIPEGGAGAHAASSSGFFSGVRAAISAAKSALSNPASDLKEAARTSNLEKAVAAIKHPDFKKVSGIDLGQALKTAANNRDSKIVLLILANQEYAGISSDDLTCTFNSGVDIRSLEVVRAVVNYQNFSEIGERDLALRLRDLADTEDWGGEIFLTIINYQLLTANLPRALGWALKSASGYQTRDGVYRENPRIFQFVMNHPRLNRVPEEAVAEIINKLFRLKDTESALPIAESALSILEDTRFTEEKRLEIFEATLSLACQYTDPKMAYALMDLPRFLTISRDTLSKVFQYVVARQDVEKFQKVVSHQHFPLIPPSGFGRGLELAVRQENVPLTLLVINFPNFEGEVPLQILEDACKFLATRKEWDGIARLFTHPKASQFSTETLDWICLKTNQEMDSKTISFLLNHPNTSRRGIGNLLHCICRSETEEKMRLALNSTPLNRVHPEEFYLLLSCANRLEDCVRIRELVMHPNASEIESFWLERAIQAAITKSDVPCIDAIVSNPKFRKRLSPQFLEKVSLKLAAKASETSCEHKQTETVRFTENSFPSAALRGAIETSDWPRVLNITTTPEFSTISQEDFTYLLQSACASAKWEIVKNTVKLDQLSSLSPETLGTILIVVVRAEAGIDIIRLILNAREIPRKAIQSAIRFANTLGHRNIIDLLGGTQSQSAAEAAAADSAK